MSEINLEQSFDINSHASELTVLICHLQAHSLKITSDF